MHEFWRRKHASDMPLGFNQDHAHHPSSYYSRTATTMQMSSFLPPLNTMSNCALAAME